MNFFKNCGKDILASIGATFLIFLLSLYCDIYKIASYTTFSIIVDKIWNFAWNPWPRGWNLWLLLFILSMILGTIIIYWEERGNVKQNNLNIEALYDSFNIKCIAFIFPLGFLLSWTVPEYLIWCAKHKIPLTEAGQFWVWVGMFNKSFWGTPTLIFILVGLYIVTRLQKYYYRLLGYWIFRSVLFAVCLSILITIIFIPPAFIFIIRYRLG
jgi:hypothetical protein